jgi:RNA recognition motif-containing protein
MNLFVSNLSRHANEEALKNLFGRFGTVASAKIISDRHTGESLGFAFVEMQNAHEAKCAIDDLRHKIFLGKTLEVFDVDNVMRFEKVANAG